MGDEVDEWRIDVVPNEMDLDVAERVCRWPGVNDVFPILECGEDDKMDCDGEPCCFCCGVAIAAARARVCGIGGVPGARLADGILHSARRHGSRVRTDEEVWQFQVMIMQSARNTAQAG